MAKEIKREFITDNDIRELINKYDPQYIVLISARNDGKSYAVKKYTLSQCFDHNEEFSYLRRYEIDIKRGNPLMYWSDFDIPGKHGLNVFQTITGKTWDCITLQRGGTLNWGLHDNDGKITAGPVIGYVHALSVATSYKSLQFPNMRNILFEEMVTDRAYLYDEPRKLFNYVSTCLRGNRGRVFMIGNTITRLNPYFREWQLVNFNKMVPGQVDIYDHKYTNDAGEESNTRILVHIPNVTGKGGGVKGMFFGTAAGMIAGQKWDSREQTHLQEDIENYDILYSVVFDYDMNGRFLMQLLQSKAHPDRALWYVSPKTTPVKPDTRVISPVFNECAGPLYTEGFQPIHERERAAFKLLDYGRIAYSDNLTGTEFKRALRMSRVKEGSTD